MPVAVGEIEAILRLRDEMSKGETMGSIWCVAPEEVTIDLEYVDPTGGRHPFWIRIKKALTVGESRKIMTAGWKGVMATAGRSQSVTTPEIRIDWQLTGFARVQAYLTDWSLEDDAHRKLPLTLDTIEALREDVYALIDGAITRHVEAADEEKKLRPGSSAPSAMSA